MAPSQTAPQGDRRARDVPLLSLLRRLKPHLRPHRGMALGTVLALALLGLLEAYPVQLLRRAIHEITSPESGTGVRLVLLIATWYACALAAAGMSMLAAYWAARLASSLGADLRQRTHDHIQSLSVDFFENRQSGDLLNRSVGDVAELQTYLTAPVTWVGGALFTFAFAFYFLLRIDWQLTLLCLPLGGVLVCLMYVVSRRIRPIFRRYRETSSDIYGLFSENVAGIREIQAFTREEARSTRYQRTNQQLRDLEIITAVNRQLLTTAFMVVFPLVTATVLWQGGSRVQSGGMDVADLVAFLVYAGMLVRPLRGLGGHYAGLQRALVAAERVTDVLETKPRVMDSAEALEVSGSQGDIRLEDVSFSYDDRGHALAEVDLHIRPGQIVALVGPSGAGKTTLVKLVLRYYDPQEGRILLDGTDLRSISLCSLRGQMGVVFQDPFMFDGTLADNIAFGRPEATLAEVEAAARAADLADFVEGLADGYDTVVGERGVKLSGGQRSRLAIARAVLRDPRILFLDEATASVDTESERRIQLALDRLMEGRTCIVVAHRLSTVMRADQIVVLSEGRLVETGTHSELVERNGLYSTLCAAQFSRESIHARRDTAPTMRPSRGGVTGRRVAGG